MKRLITVTALAFAVLLGTSAQAQLGGLKGLEEKAKEKAKEKEEKEKAKLKAKEDEALKGNSGGGSSSKTSGTSTSGSNSSSGSGSTGGSGSTSTSAKKAEASPKDAISKERADYLIALNAKAKRQRFWVPDDGKNMYDIPNCRKENGFETEMHKKNVAKVVFASSKIDPAGADAQLKTALSSDDNEIYAHAFFETTPINHILYSRGAGMDPKQKGINSIGSLLVIAALDEDTVISFETHFSAPQMEFGFPVIAAELKSNNRDYRHAENFMTLLENSAPGKHNVHIEIWPATTWENRSEQPAAMGDFTYEQKKITTYYTSADGANYTKDEGVTTELGKNNIGKIVFSKMRLEPTSTAANVTTTFQVEDPIYGRAYMPTCMVNYKVWLSGGTAPIKNDDGRFYIKMQIDGGEKKMMTMNSLNGELEKKTNFNIMLRGEGKDGLGTQDNFIEAINGLPDGMHTIRLEVWAGNGINMSTNTPVATGSFQLNKKPGAKASLGRNFSSVKVGMSNPALEAQVLKAVNEHASEQGWKESFTKVKITGKDWDTRRKEITGVIVGRTLEVSVLAKWPDGHCTYQEFSMWEDYNGSSYSNAMSVYGIGDQNNVDCN